jgi:nitrate reductase alpha subunit
MSDRLLACATSQLDQPECSDVWRSEYVQLLTNIAHVTSAQAAALLRPFDYRKEKLVSVRYLSQLAVCECHFNFIAGQ